ncbi:pyridoxal-phosphate-dependent aminotransferase family protein [Streptomyces profundus]|uniref:pyridoxal-phosphate-dependent aminotransferase family protein n=1 Tax=Streptomyces profundus TaxID=2867410 RepID=UPI001D166CAF|nr:aminotransferase class V-fold PLP-dependent enzyme [Streptomyces sp. MA3_2.13]UED88009.1 aminotransferase class V-fold PLP-dependent enzyme [Streptomyces sp. MA3_2.13]
MSRLLFNPGPTNTRATTKQALVVDDMSHRAPGFRALLAQVRETLPRLLGGEDGFEAVLFACSGTGANEAAVNCLRGPVLALVTGYYSERLAQIAERSGLEVRRMRLGTFEGVDPEAVAAELDAAPDIRSLLFTHHETATGVLTPMAELNRLAARRGVLSMVDAISSVGAHRLALDAEGPDVLTVTANKGLEGVPGVSFVVGRRTVLENARPGHSYYFDLARQLHAQRGAEVPFTVPVQVVHALAEALNHYELETPAGRAARYALTAGIMRDGLVRRGYRLVELPAGQRSDVVIPVRLPAGLDYERVRTELDRLGVEIYTPAEAVAGGYFFLATMGPIGQSDIEHCLDAFTAACERQGVRPDGPLEPARHPAPPTATAGERRAAPSTAGESRS